MPTVRGPEATGLPSKEPEVPCQKMGEFPAGRIPVALPPRRGTETAKDVPVPPPLEEQKPLQDRVSELLKPGAKLKPEDLEGYGERELQVMGSLFRSAKKSVLEYYTQFPPIDPEQCTEKVEILDGYLRIIYQKIDEKKGLLPDTTESAALPPKRPPRPAVRQAPPSPTRPAPVSPPPLPLSRPARAPPQEGMPERTVGKEEPVVGREIGDRDLMGKNLSELQTDLVKLQDAKGAVAVGQDKEKTLQEIDSNIRKIQARIVTLLAYEVTQGKRLMFQGGVFQATDVETNDTKVLQEFFKFVASIPPPIDPGTKASIVGDLNTVCASPWASNVSQDDLQRAIEQLWPGIDASDLKPLQDNIMLTSQVRVAVERCISDFEVMDKLFDGKIDSLEGLSIEGLRRFVEIVRESTQTQPATTVEELNSRKTILEDLKNGMKRKTEGGEFKNELLAIEQDIKGIEIRGQITQMRSVTEKLRTTGKIERQGEGFVWKPRETGIPKFMSELVGRGTGWSAESRNTAIAFLKQMQTMMVELKDKKYSDSLKCMLMELSSSTWFKGVVQHYPEVGEAFFINAEIILSHQESSIEEWGTLSGNLDGTSLGSRIAVLVERIQSDLGQRKKLDDYERGFDRVRTGAKTSVDCKSVYRSYKEIAQIAKATGAETTTHMLSDEENNRLLAVREKYKKLYEEQIGGVVTALEELLQVDISKLDSPNQLYFLRGSINELQSQGHEEPFAARIAALSEKCEKKLCELRDKCLETLKTSDDRELIEKARQEFLTCFRNLSLVDKQELKKYVEKSLVEGDLKKDLLFKMLKEEKKWALRIALSPDEARACLSEGDLKALEQEQQAINEYKAEFEEAKKIQAEIDELKKSGKTVPKELVAKPMKDKPSTPILDAINMVEDFKTHSTARIAPYFKDRIALFDTLVELSEEAVGNEKIRAVTDLVKNLVVEQRGATVPSEEAQKVNEKVAQIAVTLSKTDEIMAEMKASLPVHTTERSSQPQPAKQCFDTCLGKKPGTEEYTQAVKTVAQDLFANSAAAFLNDPVSDIRIGRADTFSYSLTACSKVENVVKGDILSSPDLATAQKKARFWLEVAHKSQEMGDLNTSFAIFASLTAGGISKLIPKDNRSFKTYNNRAEELENFFSPARNYATLNTYTRQRLDHVPPLSVIPFVTPLKETMEHVGENTPHDKGEVLEEQTAKIEEFRASLSGGSFRQQTDLSSVLESSKKMGDLQESYATARFVESKYVTSKIKDLNELIKDAIKQGDKDKADKLIKQLPEFKFFNPELNELIAKTKKEYSEKFPPPQTA